MSPAANHGADAAVDLVLTVLGEDRPGLVSAVSAPVEARGGSWQRSEMVRLAGKFAGVVLVSVPAAAVEGLRADLAALADDGLHVTVEPTGRPAAAADVRTAHLHLVGADRPGIVAEVSRAAAERGVGIEELATALVEAPMAGGTVFELDALLVAPAHADLDDLRSALETLGAELMVDVDLT